MRVQTIQHKKILEILERNGRYLLDGRYVCKELIGEPEHRRLVMVCYDWLAANMEKRVRKPEDAQYPIWLTLGEGNSYPEDGENVRLELDVPEEKLCVISVAKWSAILDYRYLPSDEADAIRHAKLLELYGVSDAKAFMSNFYPDIKREISDSWERVFEIDSDETCYGLIWEISADMMINV